MTARDGLDSYEVLAEGDPQLRQMWADDPIETMRFAVAQRIWREAASAGGVDWSETCTHPHAEDWQNIQTSDRVRFTLRMRRGEREIALRWERGGWKLVGLEWKGAVKKSGGEPGKKKKR
jgi:hypothetical protein